MIVGISIINNTMRMSLQQPVDSNQKADVLGGQPDRSEDQNHGH